MRASHTVILSKAKDPAYEVWITLQTETAPSPYERTLDFARDDNSARVVVF